MAKKIEMAHKLVNTLLYHARINFHASFDEFSTFDIVVKEESVSNLYNGLMASSDFSIVDSALSCSQQLLVRLTSFSLLTLSKQHHCSGWNMLLKRFYKC